MLTDRWPTVRQFFVICGEKALTLQGVIGDILAGAAVVVAGLAAWYASRSAKAADRSASAAEEYTRLTAGLNEFERRRIHEELGPRVLTNGPNFGTSVTRPGDQGRPQQERQFRFRIEQDFQVQAAVVGRDGNEQTRDAEGPTGPNRNYRVFVETRTPSTGFEFNTIRLRFWPAANGQGCPCGVDQDPASAPQGHWQVDLPLQ